MVIPVHRSAKVRQFVESTNGRLELFFLPPYSPNLNPSEHIWNWLKNHKKETVQHFLRSLQKLTSKVAGFFRHPETIYSVTE